MKVLVIGGGQAGLGAAVALRKKDDSLEIFVVDPKDYFEVRWASMRAFFDESMREKYAILYEDVCIPWNIEHMRDIVVALNKTCAKLASGTTVEFDACIVAVGAACPTLGIDPIAMELAARKKELVSTGKQMISGSGDVLVVGGGTLGCETAGEICKPVLEAGHKVIVAHSGPEVVPEMSEKGRKLTAKVLSRMGVQVLTGNRAIEIEIPGKDIKYQVGDKVLEPAIVIMCTGYSARNKFMMAGDLSAECVDKRGWINTDDNFRVPSESGNIFAFGDCCTTGANVASVIMDNYANIVHNVLDKLEELKGDSNNNSTSNCKKKLKVCDNSKANIKVLTLGPDNGVADLPFAAFESILPAYKNRTLFVGKAMGAVVANKCGIDPKLVVGGFGFLAVGVWVAMRAASK